MDGKINVKSKIRTNLLESVTYMNTKRAKSEYKVGIEKETVAIKILLILFAYLFGLL
jgi:hypothetical protein